MDKRAKAISLLKKRNKNQINSEKFVSATHALTENDALLKGQLADRVGLAGQLLSEIIQKSADKPLPKQALSESGKIAINITPSEEVKIKLSAESAEFVSDIKDAGFIQFSEAEIAEVREYLPEGFSSEQLTTAFHLYSQGVTSKQLEESLDQSPEIEGLSEKQAQSLYGTAYLISVFEEDGPQISAEISSQSPDISIEEVSPNTESSPSQIVFEIKENIIQPAIEKVVGKGTTEAKKKIKGVALKALKKSSKKLARLAAKKGAGLAIKAAVLAAAEAAGIAVSGPLAPIATALLWLGSKILKGIKKALSKISEFFLGKKDQGKKIMAAGAALLLGGVILSSAVLVGLGTVLVVGGAFVTAGAIALGTGVGAVFTFFVILITTPARAFASWFLVAIIAIPLFVVLVIFIINSGAYVVPQSPAAFASESQFINVEKEAEPSGPFDNNFPQTITYTITVTATRSTLNNIEFEWTCRVIEEDNTETCPARGNTTVNGESVPNDPFPPPPPDFISPAGDPYEITYTQTYSSRFEDSAIIDTFTVAADVESIVGERASGSESIIFGNPPTGCFVFTGFRTNDPDLPKFLAAAAELSSHVSYATKLCAEGDITVERRYLGGGTAACAGAGKNSMFFQNCRYYQSHGQAFITYLFAHESGHVYYNRLGNEGFTAWTEGYLPTYCLNKSPREDFAETIADWVDNGRLNSLCRSPDQRPFNLCGGSFPKHCDFARNVLFNE